MSYRTVLLDIDGTLVDSNDAHAHAWVAALAEVGRRVGFERVRPLMGMGADKVVPALAGLDAESPEGRALSARRRDIFQREFLPQLQPTRGAARLLEWLRDEALILVVATSAEADEVRDLLRIAGAIRLVDDTTSPDDAGRSKPDPDVVQAALRKAGWPADRAILIATRRMTSRRGHAPASPSSSSGAEAGGRIARFAARPPSTMTPRTSSIATSCRPSSGRCRFSPHSARHATGRPPWRRAATPTDRRPR